MKKIITLIVLCVILLHQTFAQKSEFTNRMNHIFQYVDKNKIATGLLSDYGLWLVEPEVFNGTLSDSTYVDMLTWKMLYDGLFESQINTNIKMALPDDVFKQIDKAIHPTAVPVAMMHYQYNALNEHSPDWIVDTIAEQVFEVRGATEASLYLTKHLFAVAPKGVIFGDETVSFVFDSDLWFENVKNTIENLEINFNNESGYIKTNWDEPIDYTFKSDGVKTIYFRLTYTDGTSYTGQTNIFVGLGIRNNSKSLGNRRIDMRVPIDSTAEHSGGEIQISYNSDNVGAEIIRKPLIVAEGFDAWRIIHGEDKRWTNVTLRDFMSDTTIYEYDDGTYDTVVTHLGTINVPYHNGTGNLLDDLDLAGYDIIYLDYFDGVDCIWRNAKLFREVIEWVNANKAKDAEPNVVMGVSMGGLVARIALRQMENDNVDHETKTYISMDSPHKGANVPLGVQALVRHLENIEWLAPFIKNVFTSLGGSPNTIRDIKDIAGAIALLNSPAAKQMLIYTIDKGYNFDNPVGDVFKQELDLLGFPEQTENIAISNGSNRGTQSIPPGSHLVKQSESNGWVNVLLSLTSSTWASLSILTNYPQLLFLNFGIGSNHLKVDIEINALKNLSASTIYHGRIYVRRKLFFLLPINIDLENRKITSTSSMYAVDGAPGGLYSMEAMGVKPIEFIFKPFGINVNISVPDFCFVPTVSALALSNWETWLMHPLTNVNSPSFHSRFVPSTNELHTRFNSSARFLQRHLIGGIDGPEVICAAATYWLGNSDNLVSSWYAGSTGAFTIAHSDAYSATVIACPRGQSGNLTATMTNGIDISIPIKACDWTTGFIFGPDEMVSVPGGIVSQTQYEVLNLPSGATVSWQVGSGLASCSPSLNQNPICVQFDASSNYCGPTRLRAIVTFNDRCPTVFEKEILVGYTPDANLIGSRRHEDTVTWGRPECFFLDTLTYNGIIPNGANVLNGISQGEWKKTTEVLFRNYSAPTYLGITSCQLLASQFNSGLARIEARLQNTCGWSDWKVIEYRPGFHCLGIGEPVPCPPCLKITYSPNPTTDEITIEFDQLPDTDEPEEYTVKLFDNLGNVPRQTRFRHRHRDGKPRPIKFNTYSLPPGTYYLHVEGAGELVREQIIVVR
ncbi:MAG: T9SS type A sorting domain-containing protein [Bacteroidales bacterium]|jgi:hypothetical protein|nr:T9SS type A sorting domain-containing protein [Bacteroidales bacterium]